MPSSPACGRRALFRGKIIIRILGIDPGSQITGFGIIEHHKNRSQYIASGCIRIGKFDWPKRLRNIYESLLEIFNQYSPQVMAIEKIFVHKNVASALKLGQVRGVAMLVAALHDVSIAEYTPRQIKKATVGYGGAEKKQTQHMIQALLKLNGLPQVDAADALAVALCHVQNNGVIGRNTRTRTRSSRRTARNLPNYSKGYSKEI